MRTHPLAVLYGLVGVALTQQQQQQVTVAKSFTGWDCCKPVCASANNNQSLANSRGLVKVCDKNNLKQDQQNGQRANSGCVGGSAFLCDDFQPTPVRDDLSYGFAIQVSDNQRGDNPACCRCYEVEWLSGNASQKRMIVQVLTPGGSGGDIKKDDLIILTPGGGLGPLNRGCPAQYGNNFNWGDDHGGFKSGSSCESLPPNLQGGCYWRFNWARGDINGWDIAYHQVECPSRLTSVSGCSAAL